MTLRAGAAAVVATALLAGCGGGGSGPHATDKDLPFPDEPRADAPVVVADESPERGPTDTADPSPADGRDDDAPIADADAGETAETGPFTSCTNGADCPSGFCVDAPDGGRVCAILCLDSPCPTGWSCRNVVNTMGDVVFLCLPLTERICRPCDTNDDCRPPGTQTSDLCLDFGGGTGSFCGQDCSNDGVCPDGYACADVNVGGMQFSQCRPGTGECACTAEFVAAGDDTACSRTNAIGTCDGRRRCTADGLTPCDAPEPAAESCNRADDDCDGRTDEDFLVNGLYLSDPHCGDCATSCALVSAHGTAVCQLVAGKPRCVTVACDEGFELIGTGCVPADQCEPCQGPGDCGGGTACVEVGGGRFCLLPCGVSGECSDGLACADLPVGSWCLLASGGCAGPGSPCGDDEDCEDLDPCTAGACGRDAKCTFGAVSCDDARACTLDACDKAAGGCVSIEAPDGLECDDGDPCTTGDACRGGQCVPGQPVGCAVAAIDSSFVSVRLVGSPAGGAPVEATLGGGPGGPGDVPGAPYRVSFGLYPSK
ncbi:MAG: hypothetical protein FJ087_18955 [Deltaproteobacteria bacterium]|nr:hypothetical protein [Deltaproteobacteria bacterium]